MNGTVNNTKVNDMNTTNVARTIQLQLGFALRMLGAKDLADHGDALSFKIRGSKKVNYIKVTLDPSDTYNVSFKKVTRRGLNVKDVSDHSGIYVDGLKPLIERVTGLYTSL